MATRNKMWFGTRGHMQWVPAPATGGDFSEVGWSASSQYLNGGGGVRSSFDSHKVYNMDWPTKPRDLLRPITDYASGLFGNGLIYFLDPMAADKNCLPQHWASPMLGGLDGVVLMGNKRPKLVDTPRNAFGLPVKGAEYSLDDTTNARSAYVPIPPNHTAWIDGRGSAEAVRVTPFSGSVPQGAPILPEMLEPTDPARFNTKVEGRGGVDGIEVTINSDPGEERVLARNLATNPSFEEASGEVVVRENLVPNPAGLTTSGWSGSSPGGSCVESVGTGASTPPVDTYVKTTLSIAGPSPAYLDIRYSPFPVRETSNTRPSMWVFLAKGGLVRTFTQW